MIWLKENYVEYFYVVYEIIDCNKYTTLESCS